jgi:preprotein translocase subunit SecG
MQVVLVLLHVVACMALILIVLLQTGRGAEMGAAFGGASQTLFGSSGGTTFLGKLTTGAAVVFMLTCLSLSYLTTGPSTKSVMDSVEEQKPQGPALPEAKPVPPAAPVDQQSSSTEPAKERSAGAQPSATAAAPQEPAKTEPVAAPPVAVPSQPSAKTEAPAKSEAPVKAAAPAKKTEQPAAPAAKPAAKDKQ